MAGKLYLVATPIGNLQDITFRAIAVLGNVDLIACEDTRHTGKLLHHYKINTPLVSYHEHNEAARAAELATELAAGRSIAVVSDAGTPGINDPGFRLVERAHAIGAEVIPIPGAVAFVNAVVASGLPTDAIFFGGFLPSRKSERRRRLDEVRAIPATLVFHETPHRIVKALADCLDVLGDRRAAVARELTKLHGEIRTGRLSELFLHFSSANSRGEFVLIIDRDEDGTVPEGKGISLIDRIAEIESETGDHKAALKRAAREFGISRSEAYRLWQQRDER
jgi:16S rRNA (cytidine1402-2'-O)-methyltransferase